MKRPYSLYMLAFIFLTGMSQAYAQVNLTLINSPYLQDFDTLAATGTANDVSTLPAGWTFFETGTNANTTYAVSTGTGNAGNTYSFGTDAADRALGGLLSGSLIPTFGAGFINNTGSTITSLSIVYRGEQWRLGVTGRTDRLDFQYSDDATSLFSGTWADINELDFSGPVSTGAVGALNGNDPVNYASVAFTLTGLDLQPGATFYVRWQDFNASGADDGLAVDNFQLTPQGLPSTQPAITLSPVSLAFGDVNVNDADTLAYSVTGANLTDSILAYSSNSAYLVSLDRINFSSGVVLPADSGGVVYVRFAPTAAGFVLDSVVHVSGAQRAALSLSGNGFDQVASIIPIAVARTRNAGEKVTVAGRITVGFEHGNPAFVQDATGGIPVFDFTLASTVHIGDSVIVTGPIGLFNEQKQISGSGIFFTKPDSSVRIIAPKPIQIGELAANEGWLVTVQHVEMVNTDFVFYPQSTEQITAGGIQADLRIDGDTDIPGLLKPQGVFDVTGVVGRFRANAQLLPRSREDIPGVQEPSAPSDSIPTARTLDIVNWNLEFFGARSEDYRNEEYGPENEELQLQNVARVLDSLHADIIAVQEISNDTTFARLVAHLPNYAFICSDRYSYSFDGPSNTFPPQKVCFIYDTTTVNVLGARALFESRYDSARTVDPSLFPGYPTGDASSFYSSGRLPFLLTVNVIIGGVSQKISLIDIHAKSGATAEDRNRRLYDATVLKDSLDAHYPDEKFIILGDLNDDLDQSITTGYNSPYEAFVLDTARYAPITKALSDAGARSTVSFGDMIDHQIISNELREEYIQSSARVITPFREISNYAATTSDHLLVITRYMPLSVSTEPSEIEFAKLLTSGKEGSGEHKIRFKLSAPQPADQQITIQVYDAGAAYNADYITVPAVQQNKIVLDISAGTSEVYFTIIPKEDARRELPETVSFYVSEATSGLKLSHPRFSAFTILDVTKRSPHFGVFPNPTFGTVKVIATDVEQDDVIQAELRNPDGGLVYKGAGTTDQLSEITSNKIRSGRRGVYTLSLSFEGQVYILRILKI